LIRNINIICIIFSLIIINGFCNNANSKEFTVGWELWYPYQFHNKKDELTGIDIEIFNLISDQAGMDISYVELPWQRHLLYIKVGKIDVAFGASYSEEREKTGYFTVPYRTEQVKLFVLKGRAKNIKLISLADLRNTDFLIGVENGYYYGEEYEKLTHDETFKAQINVVTDIEQNVKMLLKGHLDGFFADPITMKSFEEKYQLEGKFEVHPLPIYKSNIHIMLSKKSFNKQQLENINKAILDVKANGKLDKIINKWSNKQ